MSLLVILILSVLSCYSQAAHFKLPNTRIIGGYEAIQSQTKHQVSLRFKNMEKDHGFGYGLQCGGSLIKNDVVLSAAHCVYDFESKTGELLPANNFQVVMGTLYNFRQSATTQIRNVTKIKIHNFIADEEAETMGNDVALLKLDHPFDVNDVIGIIPMKNTWPKVGENCMVSGWGKTQTAIVSNRLMAVNVSLVESATCNSTQQYDGRLLPGSICAGVAAGGKDACQGDSGGPLVCNGELVGIVSWGFGCGEVGYPGIYADVYFYLDWIKKEANTWNGSEIAFVNAKLILLSCFIAVFLKFK